MIDNMLPGLLITFREGVETVLFLGTLAISSPVDTLAGFALGVMAVVILSSVMFKGIFSLDMSKFFKYTSILLILFSAGMIAMGVHETSRGEKWKLIIQELKNTLNPFTNSRKSSIL